MWYLQEFALICFLKKWSWRERNPSAIPLNINYLIFKNHLNSRITTSKTYSFEYQVAAICITKLPKNSE